MTKPLVDYCSTEDDELEDETISPETIMMQILDSIVDSIVCLNHVSTFDQHKQGYRYLSVHSPVISSSTEDDDDINACKSSTSSNDEDEDTQHCSKHANKKNQLTNTFCLPPIEDMYITVPKEETVEIGSITSIVDDIVVVKSFPNTPALDMDSVLFLEKGSRPFGRIFDVMGRVTEPFYCVRFNSNAEIASKQIIPGLTVFYAPKTQHTTFVFLDQLRKLKGSDASGKNDEEVSDAESSSDDDIVNRPRPSRVGKKEIFNTRKKRVSIPKKSIPPDSGNTLQPVNPFYRRQRHYDSFQQNGPIRWNSPHIRSTWRTPVTLPARMSVPPPSHVYLRPPLLQYRFPPPTHSGYASSYPYPPPRFH